MIISSATLDERKFSKFFSNAPVVTVEGELFPVDVRYLHGATSASSDKVPIVVQMVKEINRSEGPGDILVFMAGQDEIEHVCEELAEQQSYYSNSVASSPGTANLLALQVFPAFAALPMSKLAEIFAPTMPGHRKVVVATNIAESSITVDGVRFIIDCGKVKQNW